MPVDRYSEAPQFAPGNRGEAQARGRRRVEGLVKAGGPTLEGSKPKGASGGGSD